MSVTYPQLTHQIGGNTAGATANVSAGTMLLAGGNNVTLSQNANSVTISAPPVPVISAGTQLASTGTVLFANSNGLTFGMSGSSQVTASHNGLTSQSNQAFSAQGGSSAFQTLIFTNSNGISFSNTNGSVWASHDGLTSQSNQALSAANGSFAFQTANFSNANGISFGTSAGSAITASHNALTSQSNQAVSGSNGSFTFQTATFGNLNGLSFYTSNGSMVGSYTVPSVPAQTVESNTLGISNLGNTSGTSGVISGGQVQMLFAGGDNITLSQSINGVSATITISGATAAPSPVGISAGTTSSSLGNVVFSNSNGINFGLNGSTITASYVDNDPAPITISFYPKFPYGMATSSAYSGATTTTAGGSRTTASIYISPFIVDEYVTYDRVWHIASMGTSAGTGQQTMGQMWGLYTDNAGTLSLASSWMVGNVISQSSITNYSQTWWWGSNSTSNTSSLGGNVSASFGRLNRYLLDTVGSSITPGNYWLAYAWTVSSNSSALASFSRMCISQSQTTGASWFGTNVSSSLMPYHGIASTVVSSASAHVYLLPSAISTSAITGTGGSSQNPINMLFFADIG